MSTLEQLVMKEVRRIHRIKKFTSTTAYSFYGALSLFLLLLSMVSVGNVLANMPSMSAPRSVLEFIIQATLNTETTVQVTLVGAVGLLLVALTRSVFCSVREWSFGGLSSIRV